MGPSGQRELSWHPLLSCLLADEDRQGTAFVVDTPLVGFGGTKVFPIETIPLLVTIGPYPKQLTR